MKKFKIKFIFFILISVLLPNLSSYGQKLNEDEINEAFDVIKLELLCKGFQFVVDNLLPEKQVKLDCQTLDLLESSIPGDLRGTSEQFRILKSPTYRSYGPDKLKVRLNKMLKEIIKSIKNTSSGNDSNWKSKVDSELAGDLRAIMNDRIKQAEEGKLVMNNGGLTNSSTPDNLENQNTENNLTKDNSKTDKQNMSPILFIILVVILIAGIAFMYYQNNQLKQQILDLDETLHEKYSRLDNRLDTMTPVKDHKAMQLKFNFINDQVSALIQEIAVLKQRNEHKMTAQELYAKRTEHLESYEYNPDVQIYYARYDIDSQGFKQMEFKTEPDRESIYKIEINLDENRKAGYSVIDRSEYHQLAITYHTAMLEPVTEYVNFKNNPSRIINVEYGDLEKQGEVWRPIQKAKIGFE